MTARTHSRHRRHRVVERIAFAAPTGTDLHELQLTDAGTAYIGSYQRARVRGAGVVTEYVVRELEPRTGRVLFEWRSLDHVPLAESYLPRPRAGTWDYFHGNSIQPPVPGDPTVIVSARNTSTVYGIDRATGRVRWRLGGKRDDFGVARGATRFCAQHDARRLANGDITLFDNGGRGNTERGCPSHASRVLRFRLDPGRKRARLIGGASDSTGGAGKPLLPVGFGSAQMQRDGDALVSGARPVTSPKSRPTARSASRSTSPNASYRAWSAPWVGTPGGQPALAARRRDGGIDAWASWNGATRIAHWRLLGGDRPQRLRAAGGSVEFADLETRLRAPGNAAVRRGPGARLPRPRARPIRRGTIFWVTSTRGGHHLRDLARLRRVRDRIDREYAQPLDVEALARGVHMSAGTPQPRVPARVRRVAVPLPDDPADRARDDAAAARRPERHRGLLRGRLLVAGHVQHPLHRAGRRAAQHLPARGARATAGMPSCVAKQVTRPIRNREAPAASRT